MIEDIKHFPEFFISVLLGLFRAAITEVEVLLIVLLGVAVGFAASPLAGLIVFLAFYVTFRMVSQVAGLFASKIDIYLRNKHG